MSKTAEVQGSSLDLVKWALALFILIAAVAGFYYYSEYSQLLRVVLLLVAVVVSVAVIWNTPKGQNTRAFMGDSRTEVRKVVWPTRKETIQTTMFVVIAVVLVGIFLWLLDMFLLWAVQILTGQA